MKIIIDSYIPYIQGILETVAEVEYLSYQQMTAAIVRTADALIVRTRTKCNAALLDGSNVKFIASATIGYDHIDAEYCKKNGIQWTNAPGCNALSVAQYVASALCFLAKKNNFDLSSKTMAVIGVGAVGSKIATLAEELGMTVLRNDPPKARLHGDIEYSTMSEVCKKADIISFHTLLNSDGEDCTYHLANDAFFELLERQPIIINAARGEIVQTEALIKAIETNKVSDVVLDCWENEPAVNLELLTKTVLATPHIAGYSADGKANAASQSVQAVSRFFGLGLDEWKVTNVPAAFQLNFEDDINFQQFYTATYDIEADSNLLKSSPESFEHQRSHYPFRREPVAYSDQMNEHFKKKMMTQFPLFF